MSSDRWLPINSGLPDGSRIGRLLYRALDWQIYEVLNDNSSALVVHESLALRWIELNLIPDSLMTEFTFGETQYRAIVAEEGWRLEPIYDCSSPQTKEECIAFTQSFRETRKINQTVPLHDALYVERFSRLLPTWSIAESASDERTVGRWLTGGVDIPVTSFRRIVNLLGWLQKREVEELIECSGFAVHSKARSHVVKREHLDRDYSTSTSRRDEPISQFQLIGRSELESFLNEHVIDIIQKEDQYKALGVGFPNPFVLHGPPGCGKTYAVEQLVEYLDWPSIHVDANSVGSPYIHETSKKIGQTFDNAIDEAPSVIVIDEMESFLSDRQIQNNSGLHHVEEVGEFLRRIPEANEHRVLVVAMTNRLEMIDSAILRRGRFDHIIEVGQPSRTEIKQLINSFLSKLPSEDSIDVEMLVESLFNRPLSDVTFVVREASRLAVRAGMRLLNYESIQKAIDSLPPNELTTRPIGFHRP